MPATKKSQKGESNGNYKHGGKGTKLYQIWCGIKRRCYKPSCKSYSHYGGRGITMCEDWKDDYSVFKEWALSNGYEDGLSIDRIDNNKGYYPENCRWATIKEQNSNKRTTLRIQYKGETKTLQEWAKILGMKSHTLYHRVCRVGWSVERAFTENVSLDRYRRS